MYLTTGDNKNAAKKGAKNTCHHVFLPMLHVFLSQHLSFMLAVKRRMLLKGSHENTEAKVYFCLRSLLIFSVKHVGKLELISCTLLLNIEIVMCDFCM